MIIGILGGGQLGRMLALAGIPLGMRFRFLDPDPDCPAKDLGELIVAQYDDEVALARFVRGVDVVTYEFENVPARAACWLTEHTNVYPPAAALETAQDRMAEKTCFGSVGILNVWHYAADTRDQFDLAVFREIGRPCILKTRRFGYDGKGQWMIRTPEDADRAWHEATADKPVGSANLIVEEFAKFDRELSIIGVRSRTGECRFYPPVQNTHDKGILSRSISPAPGVGDAQRLAMEQATGRVMEKLGYVGVLAVEYFDLGEGKFLANEMAPRVHNSGHWTIEGANCSQFENHLRAVAGLPLGSTAPRGQSIMLNIIGAQPDLRALLALPGVHLHMYGKSPRPGRKLGHITVCGDPKTAEAAAALLRNC